MKVANTAASNVTINVQSGILLSEYSGSNVATIPLFIVNINSVCPTPTGNPQTARVSLHKSRYYSSRNIYGSRFPSRTQVRSDLGFSCPRSPVSQLAQLKGLITNVGRVVIGRIRSACSSPESVLSTMILGRSPISLLIGPTLTMAFPFACPSSASCPTQPKLLGQICPV